MIFRDVCILSIMVNHHHLESIYCKSGDASKCVPRICWGNDPIGRVHMNMSSVQNPGWLFDIRDYTTQLYGD